MDGLWTLTKESVDSAQSISAWYDDEMLVAFSAEPYILGKNIRSKLTLNVSGYVHDINSMHIVKNVRQKLRSNVFTQTVQYWTTS